jgi:hypothetical protein
MVVSDEKCIQPRRGNFYLGEPDRHASTGIKQKFLIARFDQRAWAKPVWPSCWSSCAE